MKNLYKVFCVVFGVAVLSAGAGLRAADTYVGNVVASLRAQSEDLKARISAAGLDKASDLIEQESKLDLLLGKLAAAHDDAGRVAVLAAVNYPGFSVLEEKGLRSFGSTSTHADSSEDGRHLHELDVFLQGARIPGGSPDKKAQSSPRTDGSTPASTPWRGVSADLSFASLPGVTEFTCRSGSAANSVTSRGETPPAGACHGGAGAGMERSDSTPPSMVTALSRLGVRPQDGDDLNPLPLKRVRSVPTALSVTDGAAATGAPAVQPQRLRTRSMSEGAGAPRERYDQRFGALGNSGLFRVIISNDQTRKMTEEAVARYQDFLSKSPREGHLLELATAVTDADYATYPGLALMRDGAVVGDFNVLANGLIAFYCGLLTQAVVFDGSFKLSHRESNKFADSKEQVVTFDLCRMDAYAWVACQVSRDFYQQYLRNIGCTDDNKAGKVAALWELHGARVPNDVAPVTGKDAYRSVYHARGGAQTSVGYRSQQLFDELSKVLNDNRVRADGSDGAKLAFGFLESLTRRWVVQSRQFARWIHDGKEADEFDWTQPLENCAG